MDFLGNLALPPPVAGAPDVGQSETTQSNKTSPFSITEILDKILSNIITEEALNDRRSYGLGSNDRMQRRRDICSILLTNKQSSNAAKSLMWRRSYLVIDIIGRRCAGNRPDSLRRLNAGGAWNRFRNIRIALHPGHDFYREFTENAVDELLQRWATLLHNVHVMDEMRLQVVEVYCFDTSGRVTSIPKATDPPRCPLWSPRQLDKLHWILRVTGRWTRVLRFDSHLRFLEEADA